MEHNTEFHRLIVPKIDPAQKLILETLEAIGPEGLTADQVAHLLDYKVLFARPRVSELHRAGLIVRTGTRRKNASGMSAAVWRKAA